MKTAPPPQPRQRGVTLVETLVSVGVLAVAAPLAIAALVRGGETAAGARLENRAPALIERCLVEIAAAREASSELLPALTLGQSFGLDAPLCLAFRPDGSVLEKVDPADYATGTKDEARYLIRLQGHPVPARPGFPAMLRIDLSLEHPAAAPRERRRASNFHTLLP